jgi:thiol-disulfide isomerase/thioredoxin
MEILGWVVTGIAALLLLMQGTMWLQSRRTLGRSAPDTQAVDGEAASDPLRVYYFYAQHCGHCRATTPLVARLRADYRNLIQLDIADNRELARAFGVMATPSFIQVSNGVIRHVKLGAQNEAQVRALLQP